MHPAADGRHSERAKRQRTPSEASSVDATPLSASATVGPTPEIASCTPLPTVLDDDAPSSKFSWTTTPRALAAMWKSKRSAFASRATNTSNETPGQEVVAALDGNAGQPNAEDGNDDAATILLDRALLQHALASLPLPLALQWNLSLDEAKWVQAYCGRLIVGPGALRAFASNQEELSGPLEGRRTSSVELHEDGSTEEDVAKTLSWVKRSLVHMSQAASAAMQPGGGLQATTRVVSAPPSQRGGAITVETALETLQRASSVATGSTSLDNMLHGGLQTGFVTEVVGFACSGKSSLVGNWVAHAVVRGALELHAGAPFRSERTSHHRTDGAGRRATTTMATGSAASGGCRVCVVVSVGPNLNAHQVQHFVAGVARLPSYASDDDGRLAMDAADCVRFVELNTVEALLDALPLIECVLMPSKPRGGAGDVLFSTQRGLLVIDSFAMLIHNSFSADPRASLQRHDAVASLMKRLKSLAEQCNASVVLTTHATSYAAKQPHRPSTHRRQTEGHHHHPVEEDDEGEEADLSILPDDDKAPALDDSHDHAPGGDACSAFGNTFYHAVNNRFLLESVCVNGLSKSVLRIVKSPVCPPVAFEITHAAASASPPLVNCTLADEALQNAVAQCSLRRRGGVSRVPDLRHVNVSSFLVPPKWNAYAM